LRQPRRYSGGMRQTGGSVPELIRFSLTMVLIYFAIQTVVVVLHEYAHSSAASLLGYTPTFRTVIWGNPLTITGWDEGVPYDRLFPSPGHPAEAVIGGIPLLMHAVFTIFGLYWLLRSRATKTRRWFLAIYCFVVMNLAELIAYLTMRPFAGSGDTGRFNEGFHLSPWPLFVMGNMLLAIALRVLLIRVTPKLLHVVGLNRRKLWIVIGFTAFMMFLGESGLRIMALYPDHQWRWGLIGIPAFFCWILLSGRATAQNQTGACVHA
jgi:hypothetical protein